jgi:hypothetical protein
LGGVRFLIHLLQFLVLEQKKIFGKSMELAEIFDDQFGRFGPIPANLWPFEIQKICDFQYFWANLATFFFQNAILGEIGPRIIKNGFSEIL